MQTTDSITTTILNHFPERIQVALRAYGTEVNLLPEMVVQFAIAYFLDSADIEPGSSDQAVQSTSHPSSWLTHLPGSLQPGIEQYAKDYGCPPEFVVELAVTFFLDPDASSFADCQVGVQREQVHLLQQYRHDRQAKAA